MTIHGTDIEMIRGDSEVIKINLRNSKGEPVALDEGDKVYLTIKENLKSKDIALQLVVSEFIEGVAYIVIEPEDTKNLSFRGYIYDIQVSRADGTVKTIIPLSNFDIAPEVTYE